MRRTQSLSVFNAIHDGQPDTLLLTLTYLDALKAMGDGRATKIVVPTELAGLAGAPTAVTVGWLTAMAVLRATAR